MKKKTPFPPLLHKDTDQNTPALRQKPRQKSGTAFAFQPETSNWKRYAFRPLGEGGRENVACTNPYRPHVLVAAFVGNQDAPDIKALHSQPRFQELQEPIPTPDPQRADLEWPKS